MSSQSLGCDIQIKNIWKIFGNTSNEALDAIQNQKITKKEEDWFIKKIKQLKTSNQKELDKVKKDYRAKIAIKLKYKTK